MHHHADALDGLVRELDRQTSAWSAVRAQLATLTEQGAVIPETILDALESGFTTRSVTHRTAHSHVLRA